MGLGSYSYILNSIIFAAMVLKRSHTFSHFYFLFFSGKKIYPSNFERLFDTSIDRIQFR
jgi:hypothetical protein